MDGREMVGKKRLKKIEVEKMTGKKINKRKGRKKERKIN
jgi:hypothetical protein